MLDGGLNADSKEFNFSWTAPATNVGPVTFFYSGIAADADGNETGDYVYAGSQVANPNTTAINIVKVEASTSVYPNPASSFMNVTYTAKQSGTVSMNLFNLNGQLVQKQIASSSQP